MREVSLISQKKRTILCWLSTGLVYTKTIIHLHFGERLLINVSNEPKNVKTSMMQLTPLWTLRCWQLTKACVIISLYVSVGLGKICYIAGWGTQKFKGPPTRILHEAALPLVSHEQCNAPLSYSGVITRDMICAGYKQGGVDTCEGDSGGTL